MIREAVSIVGMSFRAVWCDVANVMRREWRWAVPVVIVAGVVAIISPLAFAIGQVVFWSAMVLAALAEWRR